MKKFTVMVLSVSTFFLGIGALVDKVGAKIKSDERALAVINQARQAIGGEATIKNVRSMSINGNSTQTLTIDGVARTEQGELEINFQLPGQFNKMLKIGKESEATSKSEIRQTEVFVATLDDDRALPTRENSEGKKKVLVFKDDNADKLNPNETVTGEGNRRFLKQDVLVETSHLRQNELFRTTFALLLSAPEGAEANYTYAGVESIDGNSCDVIQAESGGSSFKLFIDQSSHLPLMVSYQASMPVMLKFNSNELETEGNGKVRDFLISKDGTQTELPDKVKIFERRLEPPPVAEYQVKFSDYRSVNGLKLPFRWTQTVNGQADQNVDIVSYEVNPANIADKFPNQKVFLRTKKPQQ